MRPNHINTPADNVCLAAKYGYNISPPANHNILPYQIVQVGANGAFFYLKYSYFFGR